MLEAKGVSLSRGSRSILKDVSLTLSPGQTLGVLGKNGAGKSSLLKVLSGQWQPDQGHVLFNGMNLRGMNPSQLALYRTVLNQRLRIPPDLKVLEFLWMARYSHGLPKAKDGAFLERLIYELELNSLIDKFTDRLSGGEFQRVLLAKSLFQLFPWQPESFFMLDEPSSHLDLEFQQRLNSVLSEISQQYGLGVLLISHDLNQVAKICDRVLVMDTGSIVLEGSPHQVLTPNQLKQHFNVQVEVLMKNPEQRPIVLI